MRSAAVGKVVCILLGLCPQLCLQGCGSVGGRLKPDQRCRIEYVSGGRRDQPPKVVAIVNRTWASKERAIQSGVSRLSDPDMQQMVDFFDGLGFFADASPAGPNRPGGVLALHLPQGSWFLSYPGIEDKARLERWQTYVSAFMVAFNSRADTFVGELRPGLGPDLQKDLEELQERNQRLREKLKRTNRGGK